MSDPIRVALIGYGYWGPKLLRNLWRHPGFEVVAVADTSEERRAEVAQTYTGIELRDDADDLVRDAGVDAVVVASPVSTHYPVARTALGAGKHVLVEKPLCTTVAEAEDLAGVAARADLVLMVDHTFVFHGAVQAVRDLYVRGELGDLSYYDSMRVNLGMFQPDVSVLWDLGPHDFSIMDYILDEEPVHVEASGYWHVNADIADIAFVTMYFASDAVAHFNLSWMSPVKVRRVAIGCSKRMVVWDALNPEEEIKIYNSGITFQPEPLRRVILPDYRIGDIFSPRFPRREALEGVIAHFGAAIRQEEELITGPEHALRVMRTLERTEQALAENMTRLAGLKTGAP